MLRRLAVVLVSAAVAVPLLSGTASASCTDDLLATDFGEGYTPNNPSQHWYGKHYVHVTGTATVLVEGDALVSDAGLIATEQAEFYTVFAGNSVEATQQWVDCVAG